MATLEALGGLVMEIILSKLGPESVAAVACVSCRLRAAADDEALWRVLCSRDLDLAMPLDPDGNICPSFKVAYQRWRESFSMYPWQLVLRAKRCWRDKKKWMAANFPEAAETLQKGASETEINEAEMRLSVKLPMPTRVLYRLCNGQDTSCSHRHLGIMGGYQFYDHVVNAHLLSLNEIVEESMEYRNQIGLPIRSKFIVVAVSYFIEKVFFLNCLNGQLYVGTRNLATDGEMLPCVPRVLVSSMHRGDSCVKQDALLLWLEEHNRSLQSGVFRVRSIGKKKMISLYPETPPSCSIAVTNGVKIRASAVFVPELCDLNGEEDSKYCFAYSIRMSLSPEGCLLDRVKHESCQLHTRHWIIRSSDNIVSDVHGEAVVGRFPLLFPNVEEYVYESCTSFPSSPGSMEGSFTFVPGSLTKPAGREFDVEVARFPLEAPSYIF